MSRNLSNDPRYNFRKGRRNPLDPNERPAGRRRQRSARDIAQGCCKSRCCPLIIFIIILGVAFGTIFGFIPIDDIKNFLGIEVPPFGGNNDNGTATADPEVTDAPTPSPTPSFRYMQCPEIGECCNGLESNCDLTPQEMMWPTVHNAMHDDLLGNNRAPLEEALEAGYRGLQLDVCSCKNDETQLNELVFCHSFCAVGKRSFDEVFPNINKFLNANPSETIMINFEASVGTPTANQIWTAISGYPGMKGKTYIHNGNSLPTMRELQASNKRLILFKHNGLDCTNLSGNGCTSRIAEYHQFALETNYDFDSVNAISDAESSCRGTRGGAGKQDFYHINNFVTKSWGASIEASKIINKRAFLEERIANCEKITKLEATMVAVDFWQEGDLLRLSHEINLERAKRRRSVRSRLRRRVARWIHS